MLEETNINIRKSEKRTCGKHAQYLLIPPLASEIAERPMLA
jgi:hypothetical protein